MITTRDGSTHPRRDYLPLLVSVRAFYLDIHEWALEDASWRMGRTLPDPPRRNRRHGKLRKNAVAASHQRVRNASHT